jgi:hypothetical protein
MGTKWICCTLAYIPWVYTQEWYYWNEENEEAKKN